MPDHPIHAFGVSRPLVSFAILECIVLLRAEYRDKISRREGLAL